MLNLPHFFKELVYCVDIITNKFPTKEMKDKVFENLSITLFGDYCINPKSFKLVEDKKKCHQPAPNKQHFHIKMPDVGPLNKIKLVQNDCKIATEWFLKSIEVRYDKQMYWFIAKKSIKTVKGEKKPFELKIYEKVRPILCSIPF